MLRIAKYIGSNAVQHRQLFTVIKQNEIAYRQLLGINRVRLEPGLRLKIPVLHHVDVVDMRERSIQFNLMN